jgi:hypothetical protein
MTDIITLGISVVFLVLAVYFFVAHVRGRRREHSTFRKDFRKNKWR